VLRSPLVIFTVALVLRMAFILVFHFYRFSRNSSTFPFGWEMGGVARSIATGQGFSSPCTIPSGPTALVPPVFPFLLAGIFKLFGVYSDASGLVILSLNCVLSSLTCLMIVWMGRKTVGETAGLVAAWIWVFWPMAFWEAHRVWDSSLCAFLFGLVLISVLETESQRGLFATGCGLLWGVTALSNPAILAFVIPAVGWQWLRKWRSAPVFRRHLFVASATAVLTIAPWVARNYVTFHRFIPIRDNFAFELYVGNHPRQPGTSRYLTHFCNNAVEGARFRSMGELSYIALKKQEALAYIAHDPGNFAKQVMGRVLDVWGGTREIWLDLDVDASAKRAVAGPLSVGRNILFVAVSGFALWGLILAFRRRVRGAELFLFMVLFPPLPYYVTHADNRYRHPIEPVLMLLAALPLVMFWRKSGTPRTQPEEDGAAAGELVVPRANPSA
jgi:4-amino-4-deoxy-L-arabinose transferase-like glycosyltransferase